MVQDTYSRREYVCKRCSVQRPEIYETVKKEIKILQLFKGPYIVELLTSDVIVSGPKNAQEAVLLLELCPGGHLLEKLINRNGKLLPLQSVYDIFNQLLQGVNALHNHKPPVVHRDLKLENILFGQDDNVRLCDFGSCVIGPTFLRNQDERNTAEEIIAKETTQMYRAPEMIDLYMRSVLTEKTDIWALGCILYALVFLVHPFQDMGSLGILNCRLNMPTNTSTPDDLKVLIRRMLDMDPEARPTCAQLHEAINCLSYGKPLPPYEITAEAKKCKADRIAMEKVREQKKNAKKMSQQSSIIPKNVHSTLTSDSVAAKRLAAKRGVAKVGIDNASDNNKMLFDESDPFGTSFQSIGIDSSKNSSSTALNLIDQFTSTNVSSIKHSSGSIAEDLFSESKFETSTGFSTVFDNFSSTSSIVDNIDDFFVAPPVKCDPENFSCNNFDDQSDGRFSEFADDNDGGVANDISTFFGVSSNDPWNNTTLNDVFAVNSNNNTSLDTFFSSSNGPHEKSMSQTDVFSTQDMFSLTSSNSGNIDKPISKTSSSTKKSVSPSLLEVDFLSEPIIQTNVATSTNTNVCESIFDTIDKAASQTPRNGFGSGKLKNSNDIINLFDAPTQVNSNNANTTSTSTPTKLIAPINNLTSTDPNSNKRINNSMMISSLPSPMDLRAPVMGTGIRTVGNTLPQTGGKAPVNPFLSIPTQKSIPNNIPTNLYTRPVPYDPFANLNAVLPKK